jgi:hypothetical protein
VYCEPESLFTVVKFLYSSHLCVVQITSAAIPIELPAVPAPYRLTRAALPPAPPRVLIRHVAVPRMRVPISLQARVTLLILITH